MKPRLVVNYEGKKKGNDVFRPHKKISFGQTSNSSIATDSPHSLIIILRVFTLVSGGSARRFSKTHCPSKESEFFNHLPKSFALHKDPIYYLLLQRDILITMDFQRNARVNGSIGTVIAPTIEKKMVKDWNRGTC
ncbi:hypothetical protein ANTPLA_LOCUS5080 [Anthophora plagiata]